MSSFKSYVYWIPIISYYHITFLIQFIGIHSRHSSVNFDLFQSPFKRKLCNKLKIKVGESMINLVKIIKILFFNSSIIRWIYFSTFKIFQVPDKPSLEMLIESTNGDIRASINALQFSCLDNRNDFSSIFQSGAPPKTGLKKSKKAPAKISAKSQSSVGIKDQSLVLFHGLGKILYAKRETAPETEPLPTHLGT